MTVRVLFTVRRCGAPGCINGSHFAHGYCQTHDPRTLTRNSGRDLFRFAPADIPYCGETCPGVDQCREPDHGGAT